MLIENYELTSKVYTIFGRFCVVFVVVASEIFVMTTTTITFAIKIVVPDNDNPFH